MVNSVTWVPLHSWASPTVEHAGKERRSAKKEEVGRRTTWEFPQAYRSRERTQRKTRSVCCSTNNAYTNVQSSRMKKKTCIGQRWYQMYMPFLVSAETRPLTANGLFRDVAEVKERESMLPQLLVQLFKTHSRLQTETKTLVTRERGDEWVDWSKLTSTRKSFFSLSMSIMRLNRSKLIKMSSLQAAAEAVCPAPVTRTFAQQKENSGRRRKRREEDRDRTENENENEVSSHRKNTITLLRVTSRQFARVFLLP